MTRQEIREMLTQKRAETALERDRNPFFATPITDTYISAFLLKHKVKARHVKPTPVHRYIAERDWRNAFAFIWVLAKVLALSVYESLSKRLLFNVDSTQVPFNGQDEIVYAPSVLGAASKHSSISKPAGTKGKSFFAQLYTLMNAAGEIGPLVMTLTQPDIKEIVSIPAKGFGKSPDAIGYFWVVPAKVPDIFVKYFYDIFFPHVERIRKSLDREDEIAVIILDGQQEQIKPLATDEKVLKAFADVNAHVLKTPASTSGITQPADVVSSIVC